VDLTSLFFTDYSTSRARFREAASRPGWSLQSHPIDAVGPDGRPLTIDVAIRGPDIGPALLITGGLHGVEGAFGSAVQLALMRRWEESPALAPPMRCAMVHGLNPYGFAWGRRFDENNVDPNRNFLLEGQAFAGSPPGYAALDPLLNPARAPRSREPFLLRALWNVARHGMPALKQSIAAGQYDYPRGLFFGGSGPCEISRVLERRFGEWIAGSDEVIHFDFHTGLGRWATVKLLLDHEPTPAVRAELTDWFGERTFEVGHAEGVSYTMRGGFGEWCSARAGARQYLYLCAEFGTYGPIHVVSALRIENMAHHYGVSGTREWKRAKALLQETFCPASPRWRTRTVSRSVEMVQTTISKLKARSG